jgi:hypothetical protein
MSAMKDEKFEVTIDSPLHSSSQDDERFTHDYNRTASRGSSTVPRWPQGVNEKKLVRKIDWSILPILMAAYFLQFLDKVVYNYANVMGMPKDIHMKPNQFMWGATAFFLAYTIAELPQGT